jgi:hypothetical protein
MPAGLQVACYALDDEVWLVALVLPKDEDVK